MLTALALCIAMVLVAIINSVLVPIINGKLTLKHIATIMVGIVLLLLLAAVTRPLWLLSIDGYALRHLEANAKKAVTAAELQTWATNLLAHPDDNQLRNDYPRALRHVHPLRPPRISIRANLDTRPFVTLDWDEVDIRAEIEICPTNFVGSGDKWQDGVYIFFDH